MALRQQCSLLPKAATAFSNRLHSNWQVQSSAIVERSPRYQPPLDPLISRYYKMKEDIQTERSVYNDFELQAATKKEQMIQERKRKFPPAHKYELPEYFSAADEQTLLDTVVNDSYIPFKPLEVSGNDKQSVKIIKPFNSVYLIVKSQDSGKWEFPHQIVGSEEGSLHECSLSIIHSHPSNKDLQVGVSSRIPLSVHVNKFSRRYQEETQLAGVKTFFMKCDYVDGNFTGRDFKWCTKDELKEFISSDVLKWLEPCLS